MGKINIIQDAINCCISSGNSEPIKLIQHNGKEMHFHSQLHTMILMPFGANKSTIVNSIPDKLCVKIIKYSPAGILGTINKQGDYVGGYVQQAAGKTLVADEGHNLDLDSRIALLNLMESQSYQRALGFKVLRPVSINKRNFKVRVKEGSMDIRYARFSVFYLAIYASRRRINDKAFLSRFMPFSIRIDSEDAYDMSRGKLNLFEIKPRQYRETPIFEDYLKFVDVHEELFKTLPTKLQGFLRENVGYLRRNILQFCRLFSWDSRSNSVIDDWEKYLPFIPFSLYNIVESTLTRAEYDILTRVKAEESQVKMARELLISESAVSQVVSKLRGLGLT